MANPTCLVDDCLLPTKARGMCNKHYQQYWKKLRPESYRRQLSEARARNKQHREANRKPCLGCGESFVAEKSLAQKCCAACIEKYGPDSPISTCEVPGCDRPVRARSMCSMHYRRWRRAEGLEKSPVWDEERYQRWKKRQHRKRSTQVQPIRNTDVFERDNWICGICGSAVDPELSWPDPRCATLDHIVPLSLGGDHIWENVRLAHARCNSRRGNAD